MYVWPEHPPGGQKTSLGDCLHRRRGLDLCSLASTTELTGSSTHSHRPFTPTIY